VQEISGCLAVMCLGAALASPAGAQLLTEKALPAETAITIARTALETCTKEGYHVSVHVLGRNGEVLVAVRGDGAPPHTMENSQRKAYTALQASSRLRVRYRSRSAMTLSARSGSLVPRAARKTRLAPRPVWTRSPTN